jgi:phosphoribulokinase
MDHHQAVYITNMIKLTEISIWIHIVVQRVPIVKTVKVVCRKSCLRYDENYSIEKYYSIQEFVFKILVEVIKGCSLRIQDFIIRIKS